MKSGVKEICLRIEHYKEGRFLFSEIHSAQMTKDFIYFGNYKIKKADTEVITHEDKARFTQGRINRCIKLFDVGKREDSRFIRI